MSVSCQLLMSTVEKVAPKQLAEDWDNVGLLIGDSAGQVSKVLVTLDCTPAVVDEALEQKADLILAHHPLIFSPLKQVRFDLPGQKQVARLIGKNMMFYAAHTNLDSSSLGASALMAESLGVREQEFLSSGYKEQLYKVTTFVPEAYASAVRLEMSKAGAGGIGNYNECFFQTAGTGTFRPLDRANPFIGQVGKLEEVAEVRLESVVPAKNLDRVVRAMLKAHPYEVPAYDVIPTLNSGSEFGIGRIGYLPQEQTLGQLVEKVKSMLGGCSVRVAGSLRQKIKKAAVSSGSGGSLVKKAAFKGAGVFIAGDISHHDALDALEAGMAIIDPGHYATEWLMMENLQTYLQQQMQREKRDVEIVLSNVKTEPFAFM